MRNLDDGWVPLLMGATDHNLTTEREPHPCTAHTTERSVVILLVGLGCGPDPEDYNPSSDSP